MNNGSYSIWSYSVFLLSILFFFLYWQKIGGANWPAQYFQKVVGRAVGRSENPRVPVLFGGHNMPPLIEIGLIDLSKSGGDIASPAPPGTTGLVGRKF